MIHKRPNLGHIALYVLLGAIASWVAYAVAVPHLAKNWQTSAHFGEMFGGIAALFSGLALAGVVIALLIQREELRLQRRELTLTREELKKSAEAHIESSNALARQLGLMSIGAQLTALDTLYQHHSETLSRLSRVHNLLLNNNQAARASEVKREITSVETKKTTVIGRIDALVGQLEKQSQQENPPSEEVVVKTMLVR